MKHELRPGKFLGKNKLSFKNLSERAAEQEAKRREQGQRRYWNRVSYIWSKVGVKLYEIESTSFS